MSETPKITGMLQKWRDGNKDALEELMPFVYTALRKQAAGFLRRERPNHSLQTTELIHETYLKLVDQLDVDWQNRSHFFAIAASLMRRILVDHARAKHRGKRGGGALKITLDETVTVAEDENSVELLLLDEALERLETIHKRKAQVVELRYFGGLTMEETAETLSVSRSTVADDWTFAKAWLHRELTV